jgi:hypothetical protein
VMKVQLPQWISNIPGAAHAPAAVLNITVTGASKAGYLTAYAAGAPRPASSNLNFKAGQTVANLVTVPLGSADTFDVYNSAGTVNVVIDEEGLYISDPANKWTDRFTPMTPTRIIDTRTQLGGHEGALGPGRSVTFKVNGTPGLPPVPDTAFEVVLNVTAVNPSSTGYLTAYNDGIPVPDGSILNFAAHETRSNLVVAQEGSDGKVTLRNSAGTTNVVADAVGYYTGSSTGLYNLTAPTRIVDTRNGTGTAKAPLPADTALRLKVTGTHGVPAGATAVLVNVTATGGTAASYLTGYADGGSRPNASTLNFAKGATVPTLALVPIGSDGSIDIYNHTGSVQLIVDLEGYFTA